jgi:hypothetical protein
VLFRSGAVAAFFDFLDHWKPTIRIHGGDAFDFAALRRKASEEERRQDLIADVDAGCQFLERQRPTHFLRGNHDERLWDLVRGDDHKTAGLGQLVLDQIEGAVGGAVVLPYCKRRGVLDIGKLRVIHGFNSGVTAVRLSTATYRSHLMGHVHAIDVSTLPDLNCEAVGRSCGCLCKLDMDYNRATPGSLRQAHGFAYGVLFPSGEYEVWQARSVGGVWLFPSELRSYGRASEGGGDGPVGAHQGVRTADVY